VDVARGLRVSFLVAVGDEAARGSSAMSREAGVIDDVASVDPWHVRGVEVRGRAEALDQPLIRLYPERIVSWGLESRAIGQRRARTVA
jgi:pyridoxamine 5'-phosphate oxidase family protein